MLQFHCRERPWRAVSHAKAPQLFTEVKEQCLQIHLSINWKHKQWIVYFPVVLSVRYLHVFTTQHGSLYMSRRGVPQRHQRGNSYLPPNKSLCTVLYGIPFTLALRHRNAWPVSCNLTGQHFKMWPWKSGHAGGNKGGRGPGRQDEVCQQPRSKGTYNSLMHHQRLQESASFRTKMTNMKGAFQMIWLCWEAF